MTDNLGIIRHIIEFHHTLRNQVQQVNGSISDLEALFRLQREFAGWSQTSLDKLSERKGKLEQALSVLDKGINMHFQYEEENLPPVFGEIMMKGLLFEHDLIRKEVQDVKGIVVNTHLEGVSRDQIVLHKSRLQVAINSLAQHIENHASREEIVLDMAREGLEN